jgi:hypothetical protein
MANRYEIEKDTNAVFVYYDDSDIPGLYQPDWPNGTPWSDAKEARQWAEMFIESIEIEEAPHAPSGPGEERIPKPTKEEIEAYKTEIEARRNGGWSSTI